MMSEYKIEKNVPLPTPSHKYPFASMEVGDSFLVTDDPTNRVRSAAQAYKAYRGRRQEVIRFKTKTMEDKSIRVWRIE